MLQKLVINCEAGEREMLDLTPEELAEIPIRQAQAAEDEAKREREGKLIRLRESSEDPDEPPMGEAVMYLKNVGGKITVLVRDTNGIHEVT